jgi:hypothetical protein
VKEKEWSYARKDNVEGQPERHAEPQFPVGRTVVDVVELIG